MVSRDAGQELCYRHIQDGRHPVVRPWGHSCYHDQMELGEERLMWFHVPARRPRGSEQGGNLEAE